MSLKQFLRRLVHGSLFLTRIYRLLQYILGKGHITLMNKVYFEGWNMVTGSHTPWQNTTMQLNQEFLTIDRKIKTLVRDKEIILTQFNPQNVLPEIEGLTWRHYIVYWSASFAGQNTKKDQKNIAECGVCDGLTAMYAMDAILKQNMTGAAYLYDAWEGMRADLLLDSEKAAEGSYSYLNIETTKSNFSKLKGMQLVYNKGYLPDSFQTSENPSSLVWLHIDLNSAVPTLAALDFFWNRLEVGGVILFDDFAWPGYEDTRAVVEKWILGKSGMLFQVPTGQAMFIKFLNGEH